MEGWTDGGKDGWVGGWMFPARRQPLTRVLPELVHGLEVNDVGRQLDVDLAQHHAATGVLLQHVLDVVADGGRVGPPAPVLIQPLPHHHAGQVLGGEAQATGGQHGPRTLPRHAAGTAAQPRAMPRHRDVGLTRSPSESSSQLPPAAGSGAQQSKRCGALQRRALPARSLRSPSRPVPLPWGRHAGLGPSITRHVFFGPSSSPRRWQGSGSKKPPGPPRAASAQEWLAAADDAEDTPPRCCPQGTPSSSSSSCPTAQPMSSVALRPSPPPSTSPVANEGGVTCKTGPRRWSPRVPPRGWQLGDRPRRPGGAAGQRGRCARSPGSVGCLPALAGCWPPT